MPTVLFMNVSLLHQCKWQDRHSLMGISPLTLSGRYVVYQRIKVHILSTG